MNKFSILVATDPVPQGQRGPRLGYRHVQDKDWEGRGVEKGPYSSEEGRAYTEKTWDA